MKLLVSVSDAEEARAALDGGADIIDAKDPWMGALGPVSCGVFQDIYEAVASSRGVSAALGDDDGAGSVETRARAFAEVGARFVKVGFRGSCDANWIAERIEGLVRACSTVGRETGVVAVSYADARVGESVGAHELIAIAAKAGASGVLVDTSIKDGVGLADLWNVQRIASWVAGAHAHGLFAAVAGRLAVDELAVAREAGADIVGVRGAACVGGRMARVDAERVRVLRRAVDESLVRA